MSNTAQTLHPLEALKQYFGYEKFRPQQENIIQHILGKQDALVLMPTGGGKSLCFQLPALLMPGVTVVVSPLIALMQDQVRALKGNGIPAGFLNSSLSPAQEMQVMHAVEDGRLKLLYLSPERLVRMTSFLQRLEISMFAIDEAHCISQWGHDFRPEYTQLRFLRQQHPNAPIVALTATADKTTREDIRRQLGLQNAKLFLSSFDRPNLSLKVLPAQKRREWITAFVQERRSESGIIYCLSRKQTETLAQNLRDAGLSADAYHAGLDNQRRAKVQDDFIFDRTKVICATIAFGMGIDKSNVRFVIHYNVPKNMEGYYQEIGRAGRDGLPSETILFYSYGDVMRVRSFAEESGQSELQLAKLDRMVQYAESTACRRKVLLSYFGEELPEDCGNCDVCDDPPETLDGTVIAQKALSAVYRLEQKVPMGVLIDVLRGSRKQQLLQKGYDKIKTYGAGSDLSDWAWQQYLAQLINLGYLEVAYHAHYALRLTPASQRVLFKGEKVQLTAPKSYKQRKEESQGKQVNFKAPTKTSQFQHEVFEALRTLRAEIAQDKGVPAYTVFNDAALRDMSEKLPTSRTAFARVEGVGTQKLEQYAERFTQEILRCMVNNQIFAASKFSKEKSYFYYRQNLGIEEIARNRNLKPITVISHLIAMHESGHEVDLWQFISQAEAQEVYAKWEELGQPESFKELHAALEERVPYEKLRLALTLLAG